MEQISLAPDKPPAQQMKEGLERLTQGMQILLDAQKEHQAALVLLADVRDSVTDTMGVLNTQMSEVLHGLQILQAPAIPAPVSKVQPWMFGAGGMLMGMLLVLGAWTLWPASPLQGFAVALDAAITQQWAQIPRAAQENLTAVYKQYRYAPPGRGGK